MKSNITLPLIQLVAKPYLWIAIFIFTILISAPKWLPISPNKLIIINKIDTYTSICPDLIKLKDDTKESQYKLHSTFTLLNWNIYKQQNNTWDEKLTEWAAQADFITLQEAKYNDALIEIIRQQHLYYFHNYAFQYQGYIYGVNTLSRVPAKEVCGTRYNEPWTVIAKTGLATTYPMQDSTNRLLLINLHGVNFTFTAEPLKQQLSPYLQLINKHQGPIIITGDFNTWSNARYNELITPLIAVNFNEVQFTDDHRMTIFSLPLDHVFFRGLTTVEVQSLPTTASDHTPQLISFSLLDNQQ